MCHTYHADVSGYFDLDPNRVLDIVLEAFENHVDNMGYIRVVQLFRPTFIPHIIGFKLQVKMICCACARGTDGPPASACGFKNAVITAQINCDINSSSTHDCGRYFPLRMCL